MHFTIPQARFHQILSAVAGVAGARVGLAELGSVKLEAVDGQLAATTTNLDQSIIVKVPAEVKSPGAILLPARHLARIVADIGPHTLRVEVVDGGRVVISGGTSEFKIAGIHSKEFPVVNFVGKEGFEAPADTFALHLERALSASGTDPNRYILNGVYLNQEGPVLKMIATDGRRLHVAWCPDVKFAGKLAGTILPAGAARHLLKFLHQGETVKVKFGKGVGVFEIACEASVGFTGSILFSAKLVDGNYPDYKRVIPDEKLNYLEIDRELLRMAIARVGLACSDKHQSVRLDFEKSDVKVEAYNGDFGEASETITGSNYGGPLVKLAIKPEYLVAALANLTVDRVEIGIQNETTPVIVNVKEEFQAVIMPIRLS